MTGGLKMNIYEKMGDTIIVYMPREVDDYAAVKMTAGIDLSLIHI